MKSEERQKGIYEKPPKTSSEAISECHLADETKYSIYEEGIPKGLWDTLLSNEYSCCMLLLTYVVEASALSNNRWGQCSSLLARHKIFRLYISLLFITSHYTFTLVKRTPSLLINWNRSSSRESSVII